MPIAKVKICLIILFLINRVYIIKYKMWEAKRFLQLRYDSQSQSLDLYSLADHWHQVAKVADWSKIETLNLAKCNLTFNESLFSLLSLENVRKLSLDNNYVSGEGMRKFVRYNWERLTDLDLSSNKIEDSGCQTFFERFNGSLTKLSFWDNGITYRGLVSLPGCHFNTLKTISFSFNSIGNKGAKLLIKSHFPNLQEIWLRRCQIGNEGIKFLTKSNWPKLMLIQLVSNPITLEGYFCISAGYWRQLKQLMYYNFESSAICFHTFLCAEWSAQTKFGEHGNFYLDRFKDDFLKVGKEILKFG